MGEWGRWALTYALLTIGYAIVAHAVGIRTRDQRWLNSGKFAVLAVSVLTTIASGSLVYLLITNDFRYLYVAQYSSTDLSLFYKITAFWGGNAGSLLLWLWILSIYTALVSFSKHQDSEQYLPWVTTVLLIVNLFFAGILNFVASPFALNPQTVTDGSGLNPLLQNPGMAVHPVNLYLGYIGFAVPYAYGIAALILKKADAIWLKVTRRWTLVSWLFLSMGIIYGSQWAYVELGWGGYWAWDPVENASLLPWLTGTAFLHSAMIQEKKGMLKGWNISLITLTFLLTLFGTFLTRSGILWSVHSFANGPLGAYFLGFIGLVLVASLALIIARWPVLKADGQFEAAVSKESSFLLNNLLLVGSAFTVFWGTLFPVISEVVTGNKVMVGAPYFNRVNVPIAIAVVLLMGVCPLIAWRKSTLKAIRNNFAYPALLGLVAGALLFAMGIRNWVPLLSLTSAVFVWFTILLEFVEAVRARRRVTGENPFRSLRMLFVKNRRRYGGYIVHLGIILIAIGLTGAGSFSTDIQRSLDPGESIVVGSYTLRYLGMGEETFPDRNAVYADLLVHKDGKELGVARPEKLFYTNGGQPTTEVTVISSFTEDLYVVLSGWVEGSERAVVQVKIFPLISWVWFGGYVLIIGTLISLWPETRRVRVAERREANRSLWREREPVHDV
ncbi:heme lyase CcmF/NrfE family subunit [Bacillaceae bacterium]